MDIYILRDGKETGPFSEETTQTLLKQGNIFINDLAWKPGMTGWIPLVQVLYPASTPASAVTPPPPPVAKAAAGEPATAKQKAFLSYIGTTFAPDIGKDAAAILVNEAMENSKLHTRVTQWNEDRLKLHPDLFAAEIQAKKDNRANRFFELCQTEGAEHFSNVTKAHGQVLVGYLDVRFPNWDANEHDAAWSYFFPAVAEKFPQLVNKQWRGKLKYPEGPKVAAEVVRRQPAAKMQTGVFPVGALMRGVVFGLGILLVLYIGQQLLKDAPAEPAPALPAPVADANPAPAPVPNVERPKREKPATRVAQAPVETAPAPAATTPDLAPATPAPDGTPMTPPTAASGVSLFDPAPSALEHPPEAALPVAKTHLIITKPAEVAIPFGTAKLQVGMQLKIVSQEGAVVNAIYQNNPVKIPRSSTDLAEAAAPPAPPQ